METSLVGGVPGGPAGHSGQAGQSGQSGQAGQSGHGAQGGGPGPQGQALNQGGGTASHSDFVAPLPPDTVAGWITDGRVDAYTPSDPQLTGLAGSTAPSAASLLKRPAPQQLSAAAAASLTAAVHGVQDLRISIPGYGDYLVSSRVDSSGTTLVVGVPLSGVEGTVNELIAIEIVVTVAGLIASGFLSFALIRLSLRPLDRVTATAARISRLPLHHGEVGELVRVPDADTDPRTEAGQVGASLNRLIDHVSGALSARQASETRVRQFVADASHELRTPLASIGGYAELTRRGRETVPPDTAYALSRIESEAGRMTRLVEDLLLLARLDAGRPLERRPVDLSPLVVDAVRDAHAAAPDHRWQVDLPDEPAMVDGDPGRLHQVLVNLLANAGKHTPAGTVVTASVEPGGAAWALRITDDGPGIPPELLPTVFERFARGDHSRSRAAGSTGLGLAIVAAVTASHRGTVEVASVPGRTVFTVRLPQADEPDARSGLQG
ncbi:HAMP domain-containing histidine kinase [Streptacidiphilus sp. 4-A2]|nr:HAMP domain-containing histidine kinase [Streptacidiphilus sp. 4-A2]